MDNANFRNGSSTRSTQDHTAKMKESATELLSESKKLANDLYQQGVDKVSEHVNDTEERIHVYSDKLVKKIHTNPLSSVLMAVGVGMLLSSFFKK